MSFERAREREVLRYYQSWVESFNSKTERDREYLSSSSRNDGSAIKSSRDKSLVSFAQLACLRMNVKRGIVTLISSSQQYIIAEATKSTSLISDHAYAKHDELWFGEASLPRSQGLSANSLDPPMYSSQDSLGNSYTTPAFIVNNIKADSRFSHFQYAGRGVEFYAGVPIVSRTGFAIGVYTVTDDQPRDGITAEELRFMEDMAVVVLDHLDVIRNNAARYRGERMVEGLSAFIEGHSSIHQSVTEKDDSIEDPTTQTSEQGDFRGLVKGMTVSNTIPSFRRQTSDTVNANNARKSHSRPAAIITSLADMAVPTTDSNIIDSVPRSEGGKENELGAKLINPPPFSSVQDPSIPREMKNIFARAANILREATAADGVLFHDATSCSVPRADAPSLLSLSQAEQPPGTPESLTPVGSNEDLRVWSSSSSRRSSSGSDEASMPTKTDLSAGRSRCPLLGFSFDNSTLANTQLTSTEHLSLTENNLRRLIRRYPRGKVFHYTHDGQISSSEGDNSSTKGQPHVKSTEKRAAGKAVADELLKIVPGARNVVFLPLWDTNKEKWHAACFVWAGQAERLLAAQDDLSYLKAFGHSIMTEVTRADIMIADRAKTTFIANISHELRSPLHGILGSIEFLRNTSFDSFQSAMITTVETCGKTLLDTVDHVLDYAKINQLSRMSNKKNHLKRNSGGVRPASTVDKTDVLTANFDLATILEEAVEATYAGQTFRTAGAFHHLTDENDGKPWSPITTNLISQVEDSASEHSLERQGATFKSSGRIHFTLDIKYLQTWAVRAQPGAIRRIVMNLVGNALKYTDNGFVHVSLSPVIEKNHEQSKISFCITVKDSGRGMSSDFVNNHAFTAFSQEDSFSSGTGLGLSIVRQIVQSLGGKIDLQSRKDVGTEVKVWLKLPRAQNDSKIEAVDELEVVRKNTRGRKLCIVSPEYSSEKPQPHWKLQNDSKIYLGDCVEALAREWFEMEISNTISAGNYEADIILFSEPPLFESMVEFNRKRKAKADIPQIVVAPNAFDAAAIESQLVLNKHRLGKMMQVTTQPCGPQKLQRLLYRSFEAQGLFGDSEGRPFPNLQFNRQLDESDHPDMSSTSGTGKDVAKEQEPDSGPLQDFPMGIETFQLPPPSPAAGFEDSDFTASGSVPWTPSRPEPNRSASHAGSELSESAFTQDQKGPALLVDDNEVNLKLLVAFIRKGRFPYEQASNGKLALEAYKRASGDPNMAFKYVLMDISMPVMDGLAATREIRSFEKRNQLEPAHIIALSGQASEDVQEEAFRSGFNDYLRKPVRFKELLKLLTE